MTKYKMCTAQKLLSSRVAIAYSVFYQIKINKKMANTKTIVFFWKFLLEPAQINKCKDPNRCTEIMHGFLVNT